MQQSTPQFQDAPSLGSVSPQYQQYQASQPGAVHQYAQAQQSKRQETHNTQSQHQRNQQRQKARGNQDVSQMVLCPPDRFITVPTSDLQEAFRGTLCEDICASSACILPGCSFAVQASSLLTTLSASQTSVSCSRQTVAWISSLSAGVVCLSLVTSCCLHKHVNSLSADAADGSKTISDCSQLLPKACLCLCGREQVCCSTVSITIGSQHATLLACCMLECVHPDM